MAPVSSQTMTPLAAHLVQMMVSENCGDSACRADMMCDSTSNERERGQRPVGCLEGLSNAGRPYTASDRIRLTFISDIAQSKPEDSGKGGQGLPNRHPTQNVCSSQV